MTTNFSDLGGELQLTKKRTRSARQYPILTLEEVLVLSNAIQDKNGGLPIDRILLAKAMGTTPASSAFTTKLSSSVKYGLTRGGYKDKQIELTRLGEAIVASENSKERHDAILAATLGPPLFRKFYEALDGKKVLEGPLLKNMVEENLGIPVRLADEYIRIVFSNGIAAGLISDVGGSLYVNIADPVFRGVSDEDGLEHINEKSEEVPGIGKIFIGHSDSHDVVDFLKTVFEEFGIEYGIADGDYDDQRPLPVQVAEEMRKCTAAVLIFARPSWRLVRGGREVSNSNTILYQLGAASVLYGERIIIMAEAGDDQSELQVGFHALEFDRDRLGDVVLALLSELRQMGIIDVRTASIRDKHS